MSLKITCLIKPIALCCIIGFFSCHPTGKQKGSYSDCVPVEAILETDMVDTDGDSADDPEIWIHPNELSKSRIIGTNKKGGLIVYDLQGKQQQLYPVGRDRKSVV